MSNPVKAIKRARDVMSKELHFIDGMATIREAAEMMRQFRVEALLVKKRHDDDVYGLIAIQDIIKEVVIPGKSPDQVNVFEIMTKPVISVPGYMDVRYVTKLLVMSNIRRAPVEENDEFIGMISLNSLIADVVFF
jgi:CBS domain-containing protein